MSANRRRSGAKAVNDRAWAKAWSQTARDIERALSEPSDKPGPVRTLADMSDEEITAIELRYGAKVLR